MCPICYQSSNNITFHVATGKLYYSYETIKNETGKRCHNIIMDNILDFEDNLTSPGTSHASRSPKKPLL